MRAVVVFFVEIEGEEAEEEASPELLGVESATDSLSIILLLEASKVATAQSARQLRPPQSPPCAHHAAAARTDWSRLERSRPVPCVGSSAGEQLRCISPSLALGGHQEGCGTSISGGLQSTSRSPRSTHSFCARHQRLRDLPRCNARGAHSREGHPWRWFR